MNKKATILIFSLLFVIAGIQSSGYVMATEMHTYTSQVGANTNTTGNNSFQGFINRIMWVIYTLIGLFMVVPWLFYMYNSIKAQHEEDPQAEMKKKKWFSLAIEIDVVGALILGGVIFMWFKWIAGA